MRRNPDVYKNQFGHVCVIAGSRRMLGAAALSSLAAMRAGAGLVTVAVPQSLNTAVQKKIANIVMTLPLKETAEQTIAFSAFAQVEKLSDTFDVLAIGPGLSMHPGTQRFVRKVIAASPKPLVIDADALNALAGHLDILRKTGTLKILTPHPGEMSRLLGVSRDYIEQNRSKAAAAFAREYQCVLLLKGYRTVVAAAGRKAYINKTGNAGMATAGSGDVLTGMIAALVGQGFSGFEAAKWGAYLHGRAGDLAAQAKTRVSMIASDIIDYIPLAMKKTMTED
ncbi:MAG: NAD(P)H-hydrate dehydratase [Omnitrophica WOR_2 bacterium RIFCSPHIGHO2_02_FULL_50_17]|nr:MAG: NAD(P)H-hydrate dehydratase [Omnitrophica WOR_2 bacterium RIFCSPHIGHO2_02_FULL_50_17]